MSAADKDNKTILYTVCLVVFLLAGRSALCAQDKRVIDNALTPVSSTYKQGMKSPVSGLGTPPTLASMLSILGNRQGIGLEKAGLTVFSTDSSARMDSLRARSQLEAPAFSVARDSVVEDFSNGKTMLYYYGDVKVTYGNLEIAAEYMEYDADSKIVFATGVIDSTGVMQGKPVMKEGKNNYVMESVYYNFSS